MMKRVFLSLLMMLACLPALFAQANAGVELKIDTVTDCHDYVWPRNNATYTTDTVVTYTANDTVFILYFSRLETSGDTTQVVELNGDCMVSYGGVDWTEQGTFIHTMQSTNGCDSLVKINVVLSKVDTEFDTVVCGMFVSSWGKAYATSQYIDTTITSGDCTYRSRINLTVNPAYFSVNEQVTAGCYYQWGDTVITDMDAHTRNLYTAEGCDSIVTLQVTAFSGQQEQVIDAVACDSYTTEWGENLTTSGTYEHDSLMGTYPTADGEEVCSVHTTLNLTVVQSVGQNATIEPEAITAGCSYVWAGDTITDTEVHSHVFKSVVGGCDSLAAVQVSFTMKQPDTMFVNYCGTTYNWKNDLSKLPGDSKTYTYTKDTVVSITIESEKSTCDTTFVLVLKFVDKYDTVNTKYCGDSLKYDFKALRPSSNGNEMVWQNASTYFKTSGIYTTSSEGEPLASVAASTGCVTYHTLNLTVNHPDMRYREKNTVAEACESYRFKADYKYGGWISFKAKSNQDVTVYDTNVVHSQRSQIYDEQCYDSIAHLQLTLYKNQISNTTVRVCDSYEWKSGSTVIGTYTKSGDYKDTLVTPTEHGCLQIANLKLTVFQTPVIDIVGEWMLGPGENTKLVARPSADSDPIDSYKWYINGTTASTDSTLEVPASNDNQDIHLESTAKHGSSLSCVAHNWLTVTHNVGINEVENLQVNLYPNPATRFVNIESAQAIGSIEVFNLVGQQVLMVNAAGSNSVQVDLGSLGTGHYTLRINGMEGDHTTRTLVINK